MSYQVNLSHDACGYLRRLDSRSQRRVIRRLEELAESPRGHSKPMTGPGQLRTTRVGTWRIIFTVNDDEEVILVRDIGPRGQIYRDLRESPYPLPEPSR